MALPPPAPRTHRRCGRRKLEPSGQQACNRQAGYAAPHRDTLLHSTPRCSTPRCSTPRHANQPPTAPCRATPRHAAPHRAVSCRARAMSQYAAGMPQSRCGMSYKACNCSSWRSPTTAIACSAVRGVRTDRLSSSPPALTPPPCGSSTTVRAHTCTHARRPVRLRQPFSSTCPRVCVHVPRVPHAHAHMHMHVYEITHAGQGHR